ncbi:MAG: M28 family peptidase [Balneolaceae bacterium]
MNKTNRNLLFLLILAGACSVQDAVTESEEVAVDRKEILGDVKYLASDGLEGRAPGTDGSRLAQDYIEERFESLGLKRFGNSFRQVFDLNGSESGDAVNLVGYIEGTVNTDQYVAVTAHYDHLGRTNGQVFNGADDNASGTGGLLAAAKWFRESPPENSILFIAFDAEEAGLLGSFHFVNNPPVPLDQIILNVNMDMISTNFDRELYAAGTYHYDYLKPLVKQSAADSPIDILFGHDSPDLPPGEDWTMLSDHAPFHRRGIPFIYFGVENHAHYHKTSDTFETINPDFYIDAVTVIIRFVRDIDASLDDVRKESGR